MPTTRFLPRGRVVRLRTRFLLPVLIASLPLAFFAAAVVALLWHHQQQELWAGQMNSARALAIAIGRDIDSTRAQLQHLAGSPFLAPAFMTEFRANCEEILGIRRDWRHIVLADASGRRVFRTGREGRRPALAYAEPAADVKAAIETRQPVLSDVYTTATGERVVSFSVPVLSYERVEYVLSAALRFSAFDELLASHVEHRMVALVDAQHRLISGNRDADRNRGEYPPAGLVEALAHAPEGRIRTHAFDDAPVDAVWVTVPGTRWKVVVGHPGPAEGSTLSRQVAWLATLGLVVLIAGVLVALRTSRRLQDGIEAAAERAADVAEGRDVRIVTTGTVELDLLGRAHAAAAAKIRQAEKERDDMLAREQDARALAERVSRAKDEFLAMLGHELRNPVAAISNSAALLESPRLTQEQGRLARDIIVRQTRHLARLIDDLLDVGRVVSGKVHLRLEPIDLALCAKTSVANAKAAGRGLDHVFRVECQEIAISADRARMEQVIGNLIGNAIKYSPKGSEIVVQTCREGDEAVLRVTDHGLGLTREQCESIFELFYQVRNSEHRAGGLGIGLTVVRRIVELQGGSVQVESAGPGLGSTFIVRLPVLRERGPVRPAAPQPDLSIDRLNIVIVEDNEDARRSLELVLQADGHAVYTAVDGIQGLNQILDLAPDAALVDLDLPGMDGYEIARAVRSRGHRDLLLIAHSGYGQVHDVARAKQAGFDEHVVKPIDGQRLRRLLAVAAQRRKARAHALLGTSPEARMPAPSSGQPAAAVVRPVK